MGSCLLDQLTGKVLVAGATFASCSFVLNTLWLTQDCLLLLENVAKPDKDAFHEKAWSDPLVSINSHDRPLQTSVVTARFGLRIQDCEKVVQVLVGPALPAAQTSGCNETRCMYLSVFSTSLWPFSQSSFCIPRELLIGSQQLLQNNHPNLQAMLHVARPVILHSTQAGIETSCGCIHARPRQQQEAVTGASAMFLLHLAGKKLLHPSRGQTAQHGQD